MAIAENKIHEVFVISLTLKAANAIFQIISGFILLTATSATDWIGTLLQHELIEDPQDFLATHIASLLSHITPGSEHFAAWYLLSHGLIKAVLVWALMKNKLWAYPVSIFVIIGFILYQIVRYANTHSIFLILLTVFDILVMWLIIHEYRYLLRQKRLA